MRNFTETQSSAELTLWPALSAPPPKAAGPCAGACEACTLPGSALVKRRVERVRLNQAAVNQMAAQHIPMIDAQIRLYEEQIRLLQLQAACRARNDDCPG